MKQHAPGIWTSGTAFYTRNLVPGYRSHKETIITRNREEYREWDPYHSKAAAALHRGLKVFPLRPGMAVLYLGISSGSTASFFSDIVGPQGSIYGIEIAERSMRDLIPVAERRRNIVPVLADARRPQDYAWIEPVDIVYQDVATNDQSEIMIRNARQFLRPDGWALLAIKSRSIDVTRPPSEIYRQEIAKLDKAFSITEKIELDPFEKDHLFVVMQLRR